MAVAQDPSHQHLSLLRGDPGPEPILPWPGAAAAPEAACPLSQAAYMSASMDLGLMKMATGNSCACCSRLIALPDTSRMQCFPWKRAEHGLMQRVQARPFVCTAVPRKPARLLQCCQHPQCLPPRRLLPPPPSLMGRWRLCTRLQTTGCLWLSRGAAAAKSGTAASAGATRPWLQQTP